MTIQNTIDNGQIYQVTLNDGTVKWVPKDSRNSDYVLVQQWQAAGGTITPGTEPV